jgi:hypothetical protein
VGGRIQGSRSLEEENGLKNMKGTEDKEH